MISLAHFFRRPDYRSEVTQFIDQLKTNVPALESRQRAGRALLWDKPPAPSDQREGFAQGRVAQQAYVYQTRPEPKR